jgi:Carbohydrate family 9 binding domain-like
MVEIYRDPASPRPSSYRVMRLTNASADVLSPEQDVWSSAQAIEWGPGRYRTQFRACWDEAALHVRFDAVDDAPWHTMTQRDDRLWEEEVVELFLDVAGAGRNYAEIEINPANVICDLEVLTPWPELRSRAEWHWTGATSHVLQLEGGNGGPAGWTAIARLPLAPLATLSPDCVARIPPGSGDAWAFNVFRIKRPNGPGGAPEDGIFAAWSTPSGPSFHDPEAFRPFVFD